VETIAGSHDASRLIETNRTYHCSAIGCRLIEAAGFGHGSETPFSTRWQARTAIETLVRVEG